VISKVKSGFRILSENGFRQLFQKTYEYLVWTVKDSYTLTIDDTKTAFSAPSYSAVKANKWRYTAEYDEIREILTTIQDDEIFYDIGANTGLYSLFIAQQCDEVVAFEPYPPNIDILKKDVQRNNLSNVSIVDIALSDSEGEIQFQEPEKKQYGYGSASIIPEGASDMITVPTVSGDRLYENGVISPPNIVKIDVEGAEPLVIDGLQKVLSRPECRLVLCEIHLPGVDKRPSISDFGVTESDIKHKLTELGFSVEVVDIESRTNVLLYKCYK
jgi:FkbM family methyltransferase